MKSRRPFRFRQFTIEQAAAPMPVTTDACIFGALADMDDCREILDIGSGTGLLSLMLAQRYAGARITAVEIQKSSFEETQFNFGNSPWAERLHAVCANILEFVPAVIPDGMICNPPFFEGQLTSADGAKKMARHTTELSFESLIRFCKNYLAPEGKLSLLIPEKHRKMVEGILEKSGFFIRESTAILDQEGRKPHVYVILARRVKGNSVFREFVSYTSDRKRSAQLEKLMETFYLPAENRME